MNITFVLPKVSRYPVGGYKMIFEYANRLAERGHNLSVVFLNDRLMEKYRIHPMIRKRIARIITGIEPRWFNLNHKINKISSFFTDGTYKADIVIATAVETVELVKNRFNCKKVYFIQGYEIWNIEKEKLYNTYAVNMKKIVIAGWLKEFVDQYSPQPAVVIKNPVDLKIYREVIPHKKRKKHSIALLYNEMPEKGFNCAYKTLVEVKNRYPDLEVFMFGRRAYSEKLPDWIYYTANASQKETVEIYNKANVFLCTSIEEGFGLTGLEAMACGCVLISTGYRGVYEYAQDGVNALISSVNDVHQLVENISKVFQNDELCASLIAESRKTCKLFDWNDAVDLFEKTILE